MNNLTPDDYRFLLDRIYPILLEKGLKAATMDIVARKLQMSKRTLYEIFDNKDDMIKKVMQQHSLEMHKIVREIFQSSGNSIEAFIRIFAIHRDDLNRTNIAFLRDMDNLYAIKECHQKNHNPFHEEGLRLLDTGIKEDFIRSDLNFPLLLKMVQIQFESLKRMEELFPPDLTLLEFFDTVIISFMRSIVTEKGQKVLDLLIPVHFKNYNRISTKSTGNSLSD